MLDREQFRSEETYSKIREDRKYNAKTAKLAFQFMRLADGFEPPVPGNPVVNYFNNTAEENTGLLHGTRSGSFSVPELRLTNAGTGTIMTIETKELSVPPRSQLMRSSTVRIEREEFDSEISMHNSRRSRSPPTFFRNNDKYSSKSDLH